MSGQALPVDGLKGAILEALAEGNRLLLSAPTGSGKSTRVPQFLLEAAWAREGQVVVLQPRRIAARMLAARVAAERGCSLGGEVGYQVRLERVWGSRTRLLYVTEGILMRRFLEDGSLPGVSCVVLDEFHERHLYGDVCLALAAHLQARRPELRIVVMSATLETGRLREFLGAGTVALGAEGRLFPVQVEHLAREPGQTPVWELAAKELKQRFPVAGGHALVFMPGAYEIGKTLAAARAALGASVEMVALHGELPPQEQDRAVRPGGAPRVIVATNVAETSLTIEGVTLVVDSGLARIARYDARRGLDSLLVEKISRASAEQRAGRAGRTGPGVCVRLWTVYDHQRRAAHETPEIERVDLAEIVLALHAMGFADVRDFRWFEPPPEHALLKAGEVLADLGALDGAGRITAEGRRLLALPLPPRLGRLLSEGARRGCLEGAARAAALLQGRPVLVKGHEWGGGDSGGSGAGALVRQSDFGALFEAVERARQGGFRAEACRPLGIHGEAARQAVVLEEQLLRIARRAWGEEAGAAEGGEADGLAKALLAAFADRVGRRRSAGNFLYDLVHERRGALPKGSAAAGSELIVAAEILETGKGAGAADIKLGLATAIEEGWLREMFPEDFSETAGVEFEEDLGRVVERVGTCFRGLVLRSVARDAAPGPEAAACLAEVIGRKGAAWAGWGEAEEALLGRVGFAERHFPELGLRGLEEEDWVLFWQHHCDGATCVRDLRERKPLATLRQWWPAAALAALERVAPERVELANGRTVRVRYEQGEARVAARIQELFGVAGPVLIGGRVAAVIEVLAPNMRPVQVTRDLGNFWKEAYPAIKSQLQRRYPKHRWE